MKYIIMIALALTLTACKLDKDDFDKVLDLNERYCSETMDNERKLLLMAIHAYVPLYPEEGVCGVEEDVKELMD